MKAFRRTRTALLRIAVKSQGWGRAGRRTPGDLRTAADQVRGRVHRQLELHRGDGDHIVNISGFELKARVNPSVSLEPRTKIALNIDSTTASLIPGRVQ